MTQTPKPNPIPEQEKKRLRKIYQSNYYQQHKSTALKYQAAYRRYHKLLKSRRKVDPVGRLEKEIAFTHMALMQMSPERLVGIINDILDPRSDRMFAGGRL